MYYGKMTNELSQLYEEYEKKFGYAPGDEVSVEYSEDEYDDYISDIKKAIVCNVHIAGLYPDDDEY